MKNIIESVLVKHLGKYVDGLKNSLDIGLLDGEVSIENVSLKASFFNGLNLPFTLAFSHIEKIHIDIPWTSLKDKNTIITIRGIYALLSMTREQSEQQVNPAEIMKSMVERIKLQMKKKWSDGSKDETFAEKNLIRIIDNAIVNISNIHLRMQSFRRNWDYSLGIIMDNISSFTIDEYEQRTFYHRHFTKKEKNGPFNKILNIPTFQIYHNDHETVFMSNQLDKGHNYVLKMMVYPFSGKQGKHNSPKKSSSPRKKFQETREVPHYERKIMASVSLAAMGTQTFAEDMRYNVSLKIQINKFDLYVGDRQLSQLIYTFQHFYQYALNFFKHGGKSFSFDQAAQKKYRSFITKIAKDEKLINHQQQFLLQTIRTVPSAVLQDITDDVINEVRVENEMKKIAKISNPEKSKKMLDEFLQKKENLSAMQGVEVFNQIKILSQIDRAMLYLLKKDTTIAEFGLLGVIVDCVINLEGLVQIGCKFINSIFRAEGKELSEDLYDLALPWLHMYIELHKGELTNMRVALQKKELIFNQEMLGNLIDWISLIRISPALQNYLNEMLAYSIDITKMSISFLCKKGRQIRYSCCLPIVSLHIDQDTVVKLNFGHFFGQNNEEFNNFTVQFMEGAQLIYNERKLFELCQGATINFVSAKEGSSEEVFVSVPKVMMQNMMDVVQLFYAIRKSQTFSIFIKYNELSLMDTTIDEDLEGQFYLNRIKTKLVMRLCRTRLIFRSQDDYQFPQQSIPLTRTRLYKLVNEGRYYVVFKEEVNREVNIVEASSLKTMETIFEKLSDKIREISTVYQWDKYYKTTYRQQIQTLEEIQDIDLENKVLMKLNCDLGKLSIQFGQETVLSLEKTHALVDYNQFNTEASVQLSKVNLSIDDERIIYDASFKGKYQYLQSMTIELEVLHLGYEIKLHKTISKIITIASQYQILIYQLRSKNRKKIVPIEEDQTRLKGIRAQSNRTDNLNKFLLQRKFSIETTNIGGQILGYHNKISYVKLDIEKYRNESEHRILTQLRGIILLSMIELPLINLKYYPEQFQLLIDSINAEIDLEILIFEVVKGEGSQILTELIKAYRDREISRRVNKKRKQKRLKGAEGKPQNGAVEVIKPQPNEMNLGSRLSKKNFVMKIDFIRIEINITSSLCIGCLSKDIYLEVGRLSWTGLIFQLNKENISTSYNNGILKWSPNSINVCMTNWTMKLNSKEVISLFNQINKIWVFLKSKNFDLVQFIQEALSTPDQKGRVLEQVKKDVNIRVEQFEIIYESADKHPLISMRLKPIFLTNEGQVNTINLSIWHLNRTLKLYEPVIEPFELKIVQKNQSNQIQCFFDNLYIVLTNEFVTDVIDEIKLLKKIWKELQKDETNELEHMSRGDVDRIKQGLVAEQFKEYCVVDFQQVMQYSFVLKITNHLSSKAIVEVSCGQKQKEQLIYESQDMLRGDSKSLKIAQKTSYTFSYQLIDRYKKVTLKLCVLNSFYSTKTVTVEFLLYDKDNYYITPLTIIDSNGVEKKTNLAVRVEYSQGVYHVHLTSMYSLQNETTLPLFCRYSDSFSINRFVLGGGQKISLPLWVIEAVTFGIEEDQMVHMLRLRPDEGKQEPGSYHLKIKNEQNRFANVIIRKEMFVHEKRQSPELNHLTSKQIKKEAVSQQTITDGWVQNIFVFKVIPGLLVRNHLQFPIKINGKSYQFGQQGQLLHIYEEEGKEYVKLSLGDKSVHEIYLGEINEVVNITLKLVGNDYVIIYLLLRKNNLSQRILHVYAELQLIMNIPHMEVPELRTNIYNNFFILKKQVRNNHSDVLHPSPVLKDKFVFNTCHYILSLQEKYITADMEGCRSNQIILYHSDFDKDMKFKHRQTEQIKHIYAVSYQTKYIELENGEDSRVPQILECNYTFIMPKYYVINKSQEDLVVDCDVIVRTGQKIAINKIEGIEFSIRDQLQYQHVKATIDQNNYLMFVRDKHEISSSHSNKSDQMERRELAGLLARKHSTHNGLDEISQTSELYPPLSSKNEDEQYEQILSEWDRSEGTPSPTNCKAYSSPANFQSLNDPGFAQVQAQKVQIPELPEQKQEEENKSDSEQSVFNMKQNFEMEDVMIFGLSKRLCQYGTVSYEISQWRQWLVVKNKLGCPIVLRVQLSEQALGFEVVKSGQVGKIIAGLSDRLEISLFVDGEQLVLGTYDLTQRLNHTIFLNEMGHEQIVLKQYKVKVGRQMVIENGRQSKDKTIYKVLHSINFDVCKVTISLVLHEDKVRKQLVRINIIHPRFMFLHYKNGLYMCQLKLDLIHGIFKRMLFLVVRDLEGYIQGFKGQFVERLTLTFGDTTHITVTDDMIASIMDQIDLFAKYFPKSQLLEKEEVILQEEETYHINSLGIKGIEIKLCVRKIISESSSKSKVFEQLGLSMIQVEDAVIRLSQIDINVPLKTKHINGISKMYAMESFVGIASGLNILGNPAQFMSQFQAGRNRGGVLPFCRSIVAGISNSLSKIIGTIGSGFSELTFDKQFMRNRIRDKNRKAQNFGQGLKIGLMEFAYSLKSGITGLVEQPALGYQEEGGVGVLKGTLFGITGLVTKPVTGLILAISKTIQGINSTITFLDYTNLLGRDLITRPLYHKFKMVRPYKSEDELAYNILLNWYQYGQVELVGSYLCEHDDDDSVSELLIVTCSELILIDLHEKDIVLKLKMERLMATGKFLQGVVLYFHSDNPDDSQDELVFKMTKDRMARENLYWTLKSFISLYSQN